MWDLVQEIGGYMIMDRCCVSVILSEVTAGDCILVDTGRNSSMCKHVGMALLGCAVQSGD